MQRASAKDPSLHNHLNTMKNFSRLTWSSLTWALSVSKIFCTTWRKKSLVKQEYQKIQPNRPGNKISMHYQTKTTFVCRHSCICHCLCFTLVLRKLFLYTSAVMRQISFLLGNVSYILRWNGIYVHCKYKSTNQIYNSPGYDIS